MISLDDISSLALMVGWMWEVGIGAVECSQAPKPYVDSMVSFKSLSQKSLGLTVSSSPYL